MSNATASSASLTPGAVSGPQGAGRLNLKALQNLGVPILVLMVLVMLVLPLPTIMLDLFFTFNIALAMTVLLSCVYAKRPLDFAVFPTVLLVATIMRLALNVASTRVVLLEGQGGSDAAGKVIEAFGEFVIGGNYAVGLVVFAILVIINFVVVTKGAGRVSEVTARFTLDAMPGKQMAIDADLGAGLITQEQAITRRSEVSSESDFYGAMDGASKFVRGDAIAGILILFINIIGGISIGMGQHNLGFSGAAENYVLLTIGDGLAAQIPSLLLSTGTAIIVTRVSDAEDMGEQVRTQLLGNSSVMKTTALILGLIGIIPGMPTLVFLILAGAMAAVGFTMDRVPEEPAEEKGAAEVEQENDSRELSWDDLSMVDQVSLELGFKLIPLVDKKQGGDLLSRIKGVRKKLSKELGFLLQTVHVRDNLDLAPNAYRIAFQDVTMGDGEVYLGKELALNPGQVLGELSGIKTQDPTFGIEATWIDAKQRDEAQAMGYLVVDPSTVIATHLSQLFKNNAQDLIGQDEVQKLLDILAKSSPKLVESLVPELLSLADVSRVLQNLLAEGVPVRDLKTIAEALAEIAAENKDPAILTAHVRRSLSKTIFQMLNGMETELSVMVLDDSTEQLMRSVVQSGAVALEPNVVRSLVEQVGASAKEFEAKNVPPVLLVASDIRAFMFRLFRGRIPVLHVLAFEEIPTGKQIKVSVEIGRELVSKS